MSIGHEMIRASAGSGKTYALTNRFVRLLALGVEPERIVALTFTRKAAGEFLEAILQKLASCALNETAAARLEAELGLLPQDARPENFRRLLRAVVDSLHRLRLGTLDGFFMEIAQSFALEIGLGARVELLETHAESQAKARVLGQIFEAGLDGGTRSATAPCCQKNPVLDRFIEAFKEATFGQEAKRVADQLEKFVQEHQEVFLEAPGAQPPDLGGALLGDYQVVLGAGVAALCEVVEESAIGAEAQSAGEWDEKRRQWWAALFEELERWTPGSKLRTPLENVIKALPDLTAVTMAGKRGVKVSGKLRDALLAVARAVLGGELARHVAMTRGVYAVLAAYEAIYDAQVRRAGKLTFADVERLLLPAQLGTGLGGEAEEQRLLLDYRLDAQIDHWMLDEFQDTSFGQWSILKNLIDEVIQDPDGRRSFFYVGDVKQAIYSWRGGDPRLFGEVFAHYNAALAGEVGDAERGSLGGSGRIVERHLDESWRSGPPIIEMVNRVFGAAEVLEDLFCETGGGGFGGVQEWNAQWREHRSARPELGGHAALLLVEGNSRNKEVGKRARFATTLALLRELPPSSAEFSVAVLVQNNATAAELSDYLRRESGIEAVAEADLHVCTDNPVGAALLACVQAAAHPGDRLAQAHVGAASVFLDRSVSPLDLAEPLFGLGPIIERLEAQLSEDAFSRLRLRQWCLAAGEFEDTGSRDPDEFIAFMRRYTLREPDSVGVVRVMTIHKSKGLGFDAVILPDLEGQRLAQKRDGLAVKRDAERQVEWVLDLPRKEIAEQVEILRDYLGEAKAEGLHENLSKLYVAMTRAKRALYTIIEVPKPTSKSANFPKLLVETLSEGFIGRGVAVADRAAASEGADEPREVRIGSLALRGAWEAGDFASVAANAKLAEASETVPRTWPVRLEGAGDDQCASGGVSRFPRLVARRPSDNENGVRTAEQLFALSTVRGAGVGAQNFGREVHRLFAQVEWGRNLATVSGGELSEAEKAFAARARALVADKASALVDNEAYALVAACLAAPALAQVWARRENGGRAEVWRERRFEAVIGDQWVTGVFDRVIVDCAENGEPLRAEVYDFKTDEDTAGAAQRHAPQLALYRAAAAQLTGLPEEKVRSFLVLTKTQELVEVGL